MEHQEKDPWVRGEAEATLLKYGGQHATAVHCLLTLVQPWTQPSIYEFEVPKENRLPTGRNFEVGKELYGLHYYRLGLRPGQAIHRWRLPEAGTPARKLLDDSLAFIDKCKRIPGDEPKQGAIPTRDSVVDTDTTSALNQAHQIPLEIPPLADQSCDGVAPSTESNQSPPIEASNADFDQSSLDIIHTSDFSISGDTESAISIENNAADELLYTREVSQVSRKDSESEASGKGMMRRLRKRSIWEGNDASETEQIGDSHGGTETSTESTTIQERRLNNNKRKRQERYNDDLTDQLHRLLSKVIDREWTSFSVGELVEAGADPNCFCASGNLPLHYAALYRQTSLMRTLIDHGADVNAISLGGESVLYWAAHGGVAPVRCLLEHGASLDVKNDLKERVMHYCRDYSLAVIKELVNAGADIEVRDNNRNTPLHFLCYIDDEETELAKDTLDKIVYLARNGANIHARNNDGDTPLSMLERRRLRKAAAIVQEEAAKYKQFNPLKELNNVNQHKEEEREHRSKKKRKGKERIRNRSSDSDNDTAEKEREQECKVGLANRKPNSARNIVLYERISPAEGWPSSVCTFATSLADVPANVGRISRDAAITATITWVKRPWHCVEVRQVPTDHPLRSLPEVHHGVFATCDIPAGTYLCEYAGELVSSARELTIADSRYCMAYDNNYDIDAEYYGNESRFLNSAYRPIKLGQVNASFQKVVAEDGLHILVYTTRRIMKDMEVLVDYGNAYDHFFSSQESTPGSSSSVPALAEAEAQSTPNANADRTPSPDRIIDDNEFSDQEEYGMVSTEAA